MLILTRRPGTDSNTIDLTALAELPKGTRIELFILGVHGNQVRIGIRAPKNVRVDRHEITERRFQEEHPEKINGNVA